MPGEKTPQVISGFGIKLIAILFMTLDHVGFFLMNKYFGVNDGLYQMAYVFRCLGRIAMPLFMMLTAEGVRHSHNAWAYFFRLLIMHLAISAGLSILIYAIPNSGFDASSVPGNAFADLALLALSLVLIRQKGWRKLLVILPIAFGCLTYGVQIAERLQDITILWFPNYLRPSYSLLGLAIGFGFYFASPLAERLSANTLKNTGISMEYYKETKSFQKTVNLVGVGLFFLTAVLFWGISYIGYNYDYRPMDTYAMQIQSYCLLAVIPLYFYSGKRGFDSKATRLITYLYYPVHLAILFLIFSL